MTPKKGKPTTARAGLWATLFCVGALSLTPRSLRAAVPSDCASSFAALSENILRPTLLARSPSVPLQGKVLDPARLARNVRVIELSSKSKAGELTDGLYMYVVDGHRRVALMERFIDSGAQNLADPKAEFLGSHEGLVTHLKSTFKEDPSLFAAGEIVIRNGRVLMFSNASGTYRGTRDHLEYAVRELQAAGIAIDKRTELRDYAKMKYSDPHGTANSQAQLTLEAKRDPVLMSLVMEARSVMRVLDDRFPKPEDIVHAAMAVRDPEKQGEVLQAVGLFAQWQSPQDSEIYVIQNANRTLGPEKLRKALRSLRELAD